MLRLCLAVVWLPRSALRCPARAPLRQSVGVVAFEPQPDEASPEPGPPHAEPPEWRAVFASLRAGMTLDEVTAACGQPAAVGGTDQILLTYRPADGVELQIAMNPHLVSVHQNMQGARFRLV